MKIFGTSGIRRTVDQELVKLALEVGIAVGQAYPRVIIGRDTRTSSCALNHAVIAGLLMAGGQTSDAGIVPTPTVACIARGFDAGIMITASHNPPEYNGIKLLNPDGSAFSPGQQVQIEKLINNSSPTAYWDRIQSGEYYVQAMEQHINRIRQDFSNDFNIRVVIDSGCGAAHTITPLLLKQLGCDVIPLNCYPNGIFPRDVEPIEANLKVLIATLKKTGADLGIAHDGDADRMMAIDDQGRFISGDKMLAILSLASKARHVVTTVDASMSIEEMNFTVTRTKVGDPYVSEELKKGGDFGGEPSGARVFPRISLCPDGIYAAASIAYIATQQKLSKLVDSIPAYHVIRGNIPGKIGIIANLTQKLITGLNPVGVDNVDGVKLKFSDSWLLVRPSGTEPKVRVTVESKDENMARQLYHDSTQIIEEHIEAGES